jgi:hypothetical protein
MNSSSRIRAGLSIVAIWAVTWCLAGLAILIAIHVLSPSASSFVYGSGAHRMRMLLTALSQWTAAGALSGTAFVAAVRVAGMRHSISALRRYRLPLWGALGGILLPAAFTTWALWQNKLSLLDMSFPAVLAIFSMFAVLGASCAALTLTLARRASHPRERLDPTQTERSSAIAMRPNRPPLVA